MQTRRDFLATLSALTAGMMLPGSARALPQAAEPVADRWGALLPLRRFGRYDEPITALGIGGAHVVKMPADQHERVIERSVELGVRFFDTAVNYGDGASETLYGRYLTPKYRDDIFLMTKTWGQSDREATAELEASLRRMKTDRLDLWQVHGIRSLQGLEERVNNGVLDAFVRAKEQGKARYIGFTGHADYRVHLRMFELLEARGVTMDSVQMPINVMDPHEDSFIEHVLPTAVEKGYAVLAMKTLAFGRFWGWAQGRGRQDDLAPLIPGTFSFEEATHFAWSLPISTRITGMETVEQLEENAAACRGYVGMDPRARAGLIERVVDAAEHNYEYYKRRFS